MNVHSDASYLSESDTRRRVCGHFFMGWSPKDGNPIKLNGAFFTLCAIVWFVVASAVEAELGTLFLNCKEGIIFCLTLKELGHPQPKTPVHCDNATNVGIANNTVVSRLDMYRTKVLMYRTMVLMARLTKVRR
jgi:hypothetical protein